MQADFDGLYSILFIFKAELLMFLNRNVKSNIVLNVIDKAFQTVIVRNNSSTFSCSIFRQMLRNANFSELLS